MAQNNVAQKETEIYLVVVNRFCPDCGSIQPHRIYEQHLTTLNRVTIQEDCQTCRNTRGVAKIQDGKSL
jgi:hypothetical protein